MATDESFVAWVRDQSGLGDELSYRKMFGEYAVYLHDKVVAFACDNQLFVKPTAEGRVVLGEVSEAPAYPGSKLYFRLGDELDDRDRLRAVLLTTARVLPLPKTRSKPPARAARRSGR